MKYALVTAMENKEAKTVAKEWFWKFDIPGQIHTNGGKEFVNKLSKELFTLLIVLRHPQFNAQVEVFNHTL